MKYFFWKSAAINRMTSDKKRNASEKLLRNETPRTDGNIKAANLDRTFEVRGSCRWVFWDEKPVCNLEGHYRSIR